ncbi:MAG: hypothetical protein ABR523_00110, partial [Desulfurivibrionaceae bacterium]
HTIVVGHGEVMSKSFISGSWLAAKIALQTETLPIKMSREKWLPMPAALPGDHQDSQVRWGRLQPGNPPCFAAATIRG